MTTAAAGNRVKTGTIFQRLTRAIDDGKKVIINKGGTGSGKSEDTIRWLFLQAINSKLKNEIITVTSESYPHLDVGAIRMLERVCAPMGLWEKEHWNKSKSIWTSPVNNNKIEFLSADRVGKALGARRHILYGNEINNLKADVWDEMARRSEIITADFNPTAQFWLENWLLNYDDTIIISSNYLDNPFLPATEKARIEKRASRDANFKRVHIDCEYGVFEGLVFTEWTQVDDLPDHGVVTYGMDFGFTNDPSTLVKIVETEDSFFVDEIFYQTGMLNRDIIARMERGGVQKNYDKIVADSAEPKSIQEIHLAGYNITGAQKGADSIRKGIDRLKSKKLYITKRSVNLIKEMRNYSWELDKSGNATNKPIDSYNHAIDALRYGTEPPQHNFVFSIK